MTEVHNTDTYNKDILNSLNDLNANINHILLCIMFISIFFFNSSAILANALRVKFPHHSAQC